MSGGIIQRKGIEKGRFQTFGFAQGSEAATTPEKLRAVGGVRLN